MGLLLDPWQYAPFLEISTYISAATKFDLKRAQALNESLEVMVSETTPKHIPWFLGTCVFPVEETSSIILQFNAYTAS